MIGFSFVEFCLKPPGMLDERKKRGEIKVKRSGENLGEKDTS